MVTIKVTAEAPNGWNTSGTGWGAGITVGFYLPDYSEGFEGGTAAPFVVSGLLISRTYTLTDAEFADAITYPLVSIATSGPISPYEGMVFSLYLDDVLLWQGWGEYEWDASVVITDFPWPAGGDNRLYRVREPLPPYVPPPPPPSGSGGGSSGGSSGGSTYPPGTSSGGWVPRDAFGKCPTGYVSDFNGGCILFAQAAGGGFGSDTTNAPKPPGTNTNTSTGGVCPSGQSLKCFDNYELRGGQMVKTGTRRCFCT